MIRARDGNFIIAGDGSPSDSTHGSIMLMKVNANGDALWRHVYDGYMGSSRSIKQAPDGDFIITGFTGIQADERDAFLLITDLNWNIKIFKNYGGVGRQGGTDISSCDGLNHYIAGYSIEENTNVENLFVVKTDIDGNTRVEEIGNSLLPVATEYHLSQNYPNPFNESTQIDFNLVENTHASINLYDVTGKFIKSIVNDDFAKGRNSVILNCHDLPSGVYLYSLKTSNENLSKKLLLLR